MESNSTAFLIKIKLRHSLGRPSRSDFVQWNFIWINWFSAITANSGKVRNNVYAEAGR